MLAALLTTAACAALAGGLNNAGFETGDFTGWQFFGQGWRISNYGRDSHRGIWGAVNDIVTNNVADEYRVITQETKVTEGKTYSCGAWVRTVCIEAAECFLEVQFLTKQGEVLAQHNSPRITNSQEFTYLSISNMVAPERSARAGVRGVVHVLGTPVQNTDFLIFDSFDFRAQR